MEPLLDIARAGKTHFLPDSLVKNPITGTSLARNPVTGSDAEFAQFIVTH